MHRTKYTTRIVMATTLLLAAGSTAFAQKDRTVGVLQHEAGASEGYTLIDSLNGGGTYLIDLEGRIINQWTAEHVPGNMAYLLEDGSLLRCADAGPAKGSLGPYAYSNTAGGSWRSCCGRWLDRPGARTGSLHGQCSL